MSDPIVQTAYTASSVRRRKPLKTYQSPTSDSIPHIQHTGVNIITAKKLGVTGQLVTVGHQHIVGPLSSSASTSSSSSGDRRINGINHSPLSNSGSSSPSHKPKNKLSSLSYSLYHPLGALALSLPLLDPVEELGLMNTGSKRGYRIIEKVLAAAAAAEVEREREEEAVAKTTGGAVGARTRKAAADKAAKEKEKEKEKEKPSPRKKRVIPKRKRADADDEDDDGSSQIDTEEIPRGRRGANGRTYPAKRVAHAPSAAKEKKEKEEKVVEKREESLNRRATRSRGPLPASRSPSGGSDTGTVDQEMADG